MQALLSKVLSLRGYWLMLGAALTLIASMDSLAQTFDGISIIEFEGSDAAKALDGGDRIITFVSSRGAYARVARSSKGSAGCIAVAVENSYTGGSIKFGVPGDLLSRRHRTTLLCREFSLAFDGDDAVRVKVGANYSRRHRVITRIPFRAIDFAAPHYRRHEVRGVRVGPVTQPEDVGPLHGAGYKYKILSHDVDRVVGRSDGAVKGEVAPAQITGWPWDVVYVASYRRAYEETVPSEGFRAAILEQYGQPSSESPDKRYWVWTYDLDGQLVKPGHKDSACAITADYWLSYQADGTVSKIKRATHKSDFGAWGCSLIVEVNARGNAGGVDHYTVIMQAGYAMAINHFFQRLKEPLPAMQHMDRVKAATPEIF